MDKQNIKKQLKRVPGAAWALTLLFIVYPFFTDMFWTVGNFINLGQQTAVLAIISLAMTLVILSEGIDLSAGALVSLCGVVTAVYLHRHDSLLGAVLISLTVGALVGVVNGFFISVPRLPPFVVTLGTMGMCQGLALVITNGSSISGFSGSFKFLASGFIFGIPFPVIVLCFMLSLTLLILYHTAFGTYVFSIGGNEEAVRLAGVNVVFHKIMIYVAAGLLGGVGALIMTSRMNAAHPTVTMGMEFDAIVAVVLGGTSFAKGRGNPVGSVIGAFTIAVLKNGMGILKVPTALQVAFVGLFLILAIIYDSTKSC